MENNKIGLKPPSLICLCGKIYNHRQSLYIHRQKCQKCKDNSTHSINNEIVSQLIQQNRELQDKLFNIVQEHAVTLKEQTQLLNKLINQNKQLLEKIQDNTVPYIL